MITRGTTDTSWRNHVKNQKKMGKRVYKQERVTHSPNSEKTRMESGGEVGGQVVRLTSGLSGSPPA